MNRLKEVRKALHLTTQDVAERIGVSNATVSRWENGKMYVSENRYRQLAEVYNCTVDDLRDPPSWNANRTDSESRMVFGIDTIIIDDPKLGSTEIKAKSPTHAGLLADAFNKMCRLSEENLIRISERITMLLESQEDK